MTTYIGIQHVKRLRFNIEVVFLFAYTSRLSRSPPGDRGCVRPNWSTTSCGTHLSRIWDYLAARRVAVGRKGTTCPRRRLLVSRFRGSWSLGDSFPKDLFVVPRFQILLYPTRTFSDRSKVRSLQVDPPTDRWCLVLPWGVSVVGPFASLLSTEPFHYCAVLCGAEVSAVVDPGRGVSD